MAYNRELALALLDSIRVGLERPGPLRLSGGEREYLQAVCERALAGDGDPLALAKAPGGQGSAARLLAEAHLVHKRVKELGTLRAACEAVGLELPRDGSKGGVVEKNYRAHRAALVAKDRVYAALRAGAAPDGIVFAARSIASARAPPPSSAPATATHSSAPRPGRVAPMTRSATATSTRLDPPSQGPSARPPATKLQHHAGNQRRCAAGTLARRSPR